MGSLSGPILTATTDIEGLSAPLAVLSLCSVVRGFTSLGPWLSLREMKVSGLAIIEITPAIIGLCAVGVLSLFSDDIWIFVGAQLAAACGVVIASHCVSAFPYKLGMRRDYAGVA